MFVNILVFCCLHCNCCIFVSNSSRGVFYFGHAETVVPVLAVLGLFRDRQPLRADMFDDRSLADARKFRTSAFAPFSVNVAFVLHDCANSHGPDTMKSQSDVLRARPDSFMASFSASNRFHVQLLVNERPVKFASLCSRSVCSYSELREYYSSYIDRCRFNEMCKSTET